MAPGGPSNTDKTNRGQLAGWPAAFRARIARASAVAVRHQRLIPRIANPIFAIGLLTLVNSHKLDLDRWIKSQLSSKCAKARRLRISLRMPYGSQRGLGAAKRGHSSAARPTIR